MTTTQTETITSANVGQVPAEVIQTAAAQSKAKKANAVFDQMFAQNPVPARKDMIAAAKAAAGLTDAGAATYLQNYKAKRGLTQPRVMVPMAMPKQEAAEASA